MTGKVVAPGEGIARYALGGTDGELKCAGESTHEQFAVCEWTLAPGSFAPPLHRHREIDEAMYVIEGALELTIDGTTSRAAAGAFVAIPAGTSHTLAPADQQPARILMITSAPSRTVEMYEALAEGFAAGPPDPDAMAAVLGRLDMEVLAPPITA